jgi:hypothetical protein
MGPALPRLFGGRLPGGEGHKGMTKQNGKRRQADQAHEIISTN